MFSFSSSNFYIWVEIFYISGRVTMSTLRIPVCLSPDKLISTTKVTNLFLICMPIWNKRVIEHKAMKTKFWIVEKKFGVKPKFIKLTSIQKVTNQYFGAVLILIELSNVHKVMKQSFWIFNYFKIYW